MADNMNLVVEGLVKFRDGKKWKPRWCMLKKPSPVADRIQVLLYKEIKDATKGNQPKQEFFVEGFYGLETVRFDKETNVLCVVCQKQVILFAFENREQLIQFEIKIRKALGEEDQFIVDIKKVPNSSKLQLDRVRILIHGQKFCFTTSVPPKILCSWQISDLRRFGSVEGKFVFEGGSRCAKGSGLHYVASKQAEEIAEIVTLASQGKTASCRKANKRRSQCCDLSEPGGRLFSDGFYKDFHNSFNDSQIKFMHDNRWPKRHSFYSDHSHHLRSIENLERDRLMALYDVPPSRIRKVEAFKCTKKLSLNSIEYKSQEDSSQSSTFGSGNTVISRNEEVGETESSLLLDKNNEKNVSSLSVFSCNSELSLFENNTENQSFLGCNTKVSASAPALCGYGAYIFDQQRNMTGSVPNRIDEEIDRIADMTRRQDARDRLSGEEEILQRELSLLDEILEGCKVESRKREKNRPPPLPCRATRPTKRPSNISLSPRHLMIHNDQTLLSPNLASKLNKIPPCSKLSAPLPYVNLDKYDVGDVDNSHVYVPANVPPKDQGNWSAPCIRSGSFDNINKKTANKENRNVSRKCSSSSDGLQNMHNIEDLNRGRLRESNYANEFPFEDKQNSPPKLPPKGPKLKSRNNQQSQDNIPPPLPSRRRSLETQYQNSFDFPSKREPSAPIREENYLVMGNFEKEPPNIHMSSHGKLQDELNCELMVKLPTRMSKSRRDPPKPPIQEVSGDSSSCYIEMAGQFQPEPKPTTVEQTLPSKPQYFRSNSASAISDKHIFPLNFNHSFSGCTDVSSTKGLVREENYLLMSALKTPPRASSESHVASQVQEESRDSSCVRKDSSDSLSSSESHSTDRKPSLIPFPNLRNYQKHNIIKSAKTPDKPNPVRSNSEKVQNESGKSPGFLTRLMRRNSGTRKSMSQSQENLLASSSSESCLERVQNAKTANKDTISCSSDSSPSNSRYQSQQDISLTIVERRRSSSFPNRSSFLDMLPQSGNDEKMAHHESQESFVSTVSMDDNMQLIVSEEKPAISSLIKENEKTNKFYMGPCQNNEYQEHEKKTPEIKRKVSDFPSPKTSSKFSKNHSNDVYTVRHVKRTTYEYEKPEDTSKTDDEKLIEKLLTRDRNKLSGDDCDSLKMKLSVDCKLDEETDRSKTQKQSPAEEAAAIARLVTSLPPFIPPKLKSNPCSLSPVLESAPYTPSKSILHDTWRSNFSFKSYHSLADSQSNRHVPTHSEITSAMLIVVDDKETKPSVWVPMSPEGEKKEESIQEQEEKFKAIVVEVDETQNEDDTISLSSQESSLDEGTRSSPASTILRPRSGKEYKLIERRYMGTESFTTSPVPTPTSPSGASIFTFDISASPSQQSICSQDQESLSLSKASRSDSIPPKLPDRVSPYRAYMNITPPSSPLKNSSTTLSTEGERQLVYAEIDLSLPTRASRKSRKASMKSQKSYATNVEYAMIDMEATQAIQRAGREHAQTRVDSTIQRAGREHAQTRVDSSSLRRIDRKASLSSFRDRKPSNSSSSPSFRDRKYSSSSSDSGHGE